MIIMWEICKNQVKTKQETKCKTGLPSVRLILFNSNTILTRFCKGKENFRSKISHKKTRLWTINLEQLHNILMQCSQTLVQSPALIMNWLNTKTLMNKIRKMNFICNKKIEHE